MNSLMNDLIRCKKANNKFGKEMVANALYNVLKHEINDINIFEANYNSYFTEDGLSNYDFMDAILTIFPDLYTIMDERLKYNSNLLLHILKEKDALELIEGKNELDDKFWEELIQLKPNMYKYAPLNVRKNKDMLSSYLIYYYKNEGFDNTDYYTVKNNNKIMNILRNEYARYFINVIPPMDYKEDKDLILIEKFESLYYIDEDIINNQEELTVLLKELFEMLKKDIQVKDILEDIYKYNVETEGYKKIFS